MHPELLAPILAVAFAKPVCKLLQFRIAVRSHERMTERGDLEGTRGLRRLISAMERRPR